MSSDRRHFGCRDFEREWEHKRPWWNIPRSRSATPDQNHEDQDTRIDAPHGNAGERSDADWWRPGWTGYTPEQRRLIRDETMAVVRQKEFV